MKTTKLFLLTFAAALLPLFAASASYQQTQSKPAPAPSQTPAALPFALKPLGHNAYAAITVLGTAAGSNSGFIIGDDGVLVVDSFQNAGAARALLAEIHKLTPLPVKYVVNTHYHIDHVTGNGVYVEAGATIVAHKNVRDWIHTENLKFYGPAITPEQKASVENLAGPQIVYDAAMDLRLGSRHVAVNFFPGHTGGDSVIYDQESNVVFCGDLFWRHTLPNLIDASTDSWIATLATLAQMHPNAKFISGHGDVGAADDVTAFRGYLVDLRQLVTEGRAAGKSGDALVEQVLPKLKEKYGDWDAFTFLAKRDILDTDAELAGTKKIPHAASGK